MRCGWRRCLFALLLSVLLHWRCRRDLQAALVEAAKAKADPLTGKKDTSGGKVVFNLKRRMLLGPRSPSFPPLPGCEFVALLLHALCGGLRERADPEEEARAALEVASGDAARAALLDENAAFTACAVLSQFDPTYTTPSSSTAGDEEISLSPTE